jgi:hypothetical protein
VVFSREFLWIESVDAAAAVFARRAIYYIRILKLFRK